MTKSSDKKSVVRETPVTVRDQGKERAIIIEVKSQTLEMRLKGCKTRYVVGVESIYWLAVAREAGALESIRPCTNKKKRVSRRGI